MLYEVAYKTDTLERGTVQLEAETLYDVHAWAEERGWEIEGTQVVKEPNPLGAEPIKIPSYLQAIKATWNAERDREDALINSVWKIRTNEERDRSNALPSEAGAIALAWLGLLCVPLCMLGMIWGIVLMTQTNSQRGVHAFVVGGFLTLSWGVTVIFIYPKLGL